MQKEKLRITNNGVKIYDYNNPSSHSFFISLFVRAGSMHESESGITHFLEHALIRNVAKVMNNELYPTLDKHGMEFNASTYSEMVQFYISGATKNFKHAAKIIATLFSPIILTPAEIRTECERIKAEIRESDDRTSLATFTNGIVNEGTTLSRSITGTLGGVSKITKSRLEEYRRSVMTGENVFFYVSGSYTDEDISSLSREIEKYGIPRGVMTENIAPKSAGFGNREGRVYLKNADFTMLRFTFDMDMSKMTFPETDLIYDMLLGGYNSRFFIEMSEKRGLFYDITGSSERYKNIGFFTFSFEVRSGSVYEALEIAISELKEFKENLFDDSQLMKAGYVDNAYLLYDDARELNFTFAYDNHVMNLGYENIEARKNAYSSVTQERIREVARELFRPENLTLTLKGNKKKIDTKKLEEIIKTL